MSRKIYYWKLRDSEMQLGERTLIMGVLNVTPDSFSDGGHFNDPDRAYARALELEEQGADIIDIGAESTKPGSHRITADEEWQRLVPVLKRLRGNLRAPLSLDTYKSEIAERALQYGVEIFNDPSGLTFDPNLVKVAANGNAGLILNHMRGQPETWAKLPPMQNVIGSIARELEATANRARHAGVERGRIVIDPGLGFGKRKEQNAEILAYLKQLSGLDYPILVGPSRKSFLVQASENETLFATAAAVAASVLNGAHIVRVHDVREMHVVVRVAEEIARAGVPKPVQNDERPVAHARPQPTPNVEAERPRPTRPPYSKPISKPPVSNPIPIEEQRAAPPARADRPSYPDRERRPEREKRDGSAPPRRDFKPPREFKNDRFKPAAPSRPFVRKDDRREGRPSRPMDREQSRPPFSKPAYSKPDRPPRSAPPRSGPGRSGPSDDRFKPSGPKRSFDRGGDRGGDRRADRGESRPPRGGAPPAPKGRPGGDRPPKRPFRKRP
ncbi:MAG: dihydropteroate synthase [Bryobacteraceae bacterium]|jgi:dihydropteroate synthase